MRLHPFGNRGLDAQSSSVSSATRWTVNDFQPQDMLLIVRTIPVFRSGEERP
jgi:hypothetical protein